MVVKPEPNRAIKSLVYKSSEMGLLLRAASALDRRVGSAAAPGRCSQKASAARRKIDHPPPATLPSPTAA